MSVQAPSARRSDSAHLHEAPLPAGRPFPWRAALALVCALAVVYHWLQSRGHVTPAVFTDELLFSELARSIAAGEGFVVRDQPLFFPAFVPSLMQAPAWLAGSTPLAYASAKALNTVLMCSAALPAFWLARQLVRPAYALIVAAATVAGGGMLYHGYLTSEAVAYPVFLLAVAVSVRALAAPSISSDVIAVAVLFLAVLTRAQFVVLPLVFVLAVLLVGRPLRRHLTALAALGGAAVLALIAGASVLGFYEGARTLDYPLGETLRWTAWTAALLPFGAGLLVVPGAVLGLAYAVSREHRAAQRAFGVVTALLLTLMPLQAGLIAAGESHKPFERYVFYLVPLVFIAFFAFAERSVSGRRLYAGIALGLAGFALLVPFASLALDPFSFDSPTLSAVETRGRWTSQGDAAALFAAAGVLGAVAAVALQRRPALLGIACVVLAFSIGVAAYDGDRRMTRRTLASLAGSQPDWLERSGIPRADVLALPGGSLHSGWVLESWNRNVGRTLHLGDVPHDQLPYTQVAIQTDGAVVTVAGEPVRSRYLVVNDAGTQVELDGRLITRPRPGLSLYRTDGMLRLSSYAEGFDRDGWARSVASYRVWPAGVSRGSYYLKLSLPRGRRARLVEAEAGPVQRRVLLRPGASITLRVPVSGRPLPELGIRIDRADFVGADTARPRLVAARVNTLRFVSEVGGARLKPGTPRTPVKGSRN
jgi:hypothetical protein